MTACAYELQGATEQPTKQRSGSYRLQLDLANVQCRLLSRKQNFRWIGFNRSARRRYTENTLFVWMSVAGAEHVCQSGVWNRLQQLSWGCTATARLRQTWQLRIPFKRTRSGSSSAHMISLTGCVGPRSCSLALHIYCRTESCFGNLQAHLGLLYSKGRGASMRIVAHAQSFADKFRKVRVG